MSHNPRGGRRMYHRGIVLVSASVVVGAASVIPLTAFSAPARADTSAAVITPLLTLFEFGDSVGLPEGCQTALTTATAVVAQAKASEQFSPLAAEIGAQCSTMSAAGSKLIQSGIAASQTASAINAVVNPGIAAGSSALTTIGDEPGIQQSPLGPTIAGLGPTVAYFEGH